MDALVQYPEGSFGKAYVTWLERCGVTPDTRAPVGGVFSRSSHELIFLRYNTSMTQSLHT